MKIRRKRTNKRERSERPIGSSFRYSHYIQNGIDMWCRNHMTARAINLLLTVFCAPSTWTLSCPPTKVIVFFLCRLPYCCSPLDVPLKQQRAAPAKALAGTRCQTGTHRMRDFTVTRLWLAEARAHRTARSCRTTPAWSNDHRTRRANAALRRDPQI